LHANSFFLKMTAFWDIAPCSLVEVGRRFRGVYCLHHQEWDYTAQYPRWLSSSYSPPWEPEISLSFLLINTTTLFQSPSRHQTRSSTLFHLGRRRKFWTASHLNVTRRKSMDLYDVTCNFTAVQTHCL
jgi:hypothetical protein